MGTTNDVCLTLQIASTQKRITTMFKNAVGWNTKIAGVFSLIILILAGSPAEAQVQNKRSYTLAGRQLLLIERMTNSALFAALGIDAAPGLTSIHWSRNRFDRMQTELRDGNPYLGLNPTMKPELLDKLDIADLRWQRYDSLFGEITTSASVSKAQIRALTASHADTIKALSQMVDSYGYFAYGGSYHSILSTTIIETGQLRADTQLVLRGLMMAAYHDYAAPERQLLDQLTKDFDKTINGLIHGNPQLRLLPAATDEIKIELTKVDLMWKKVQPILKSAAAGKAVTKDEITTVAQYANDMAVPLTMALIMYLSI